jgi:hypothetical protein
MELASRVAPATRPVLAHQDAVNIAGHAAIRVDRIRPADCQTAIE